MARMLHDWSSEGQSIPPAVKATAVVVGAFLITGILYFVVQQGMSVASNRVGSRYAQFDESRGSGDAAPLNPTFANPVSPINPALPLNGPQSFGAPSVSAGSGRTGGIMRFSQAGPTSTSIAPPVLTTTDGFTSNEERTRGRNQIKALRGTLTTLKQYDSRSLWTGVSILDHARQVQLNAVNGVAGESNTLNLNDSGSPAEADAVRKNMTSKLLGELEALNGEVALSSHPERFPEPLHDGAEAVGGAMRTYLATARMAVARPEEQSILKNRAARELSRVDELVRAMEAPLTGGASAAN